MYRKLSILVVALVIFILGFFSQELISKKEVRKTTRKPIVTINKLIIDQPIEDMEGNSTTIRSMIRDGLEIDFEYLQYLSKEDVVSHCSSNLRNNIQAGGGISIEEYEKLGNILFRLCLSKYNVEPFDLL